MWSAFDNVETLKFLLSCLTTIPYDNLLQHFMVCQVVYVASIDLKKRLDRASYCNKWELIAMLSIRCTVHRS